MLDNVIQDMVATGQTEYLVFEAEKEDGIIIRVANPHSRMKNQELHRMFEKGYSTKGEDRNYICFSVMIG